MHEEKCESIENERDDIDGICFDCKEHASVIELTCTCGQDFEEVSSCCGSKIWSN